MAAKPTVHTGNLTYAQLESVWLQASQGTKYNTQQWAALMAAIALAESSGNPLNENKTDNNGTQTSWGLWQISNGTHSEPSADWATPLGNARLAIDKLNTQGLKAWGTYDSGAYKHFMQGSTTPDNSWQGIWTGGATEGGQGIAGIGGSTDTSSQTCLLPISYGVGNICLMSKTNARALIGGALMGTALLLTITSAALIITVGLKKANPVLNALTGSGPVAPLYKAALKPRRIRPSEPEIENPE